MTMRAWVVAPHGRAGLVRTERPVPTPGPDELLVRVQVCGVCRTDLHLALHELAPRRAGTVPGHEVDPAARPGAAGAAPILDPAGDFLPTYTGPQDPGLDVLAHQVTLSGNRIILYGQMAGPIAPTQTVGGLYLFGIDRGTGTPRSSTMRTS